jgi:Tfp pilus assembly protein PilN
MMRGLWSFHLLAYVLPFSQPVSAAASPSIHSVRFVKPWLGGFNLLPYRQRNARLARLRCWREWLIAALAGVVAVLVLGAWQAVVKARLDGQRAALERSLAQNAAPLAEHARLTREQNEQRDKAARAASLSKSLTHLRDLLDALSFEPGDGVVLRQLRQREQATELLATSRGHLASAEWLKRLGAIHGVQGVEMSDLHRPASQGHGPVDESATGPIEFGARLRWDEPVVKTAKAAGPVASRAVKSELSGGTR